VADITSGEFELQVCSVVVTRNHALARRLVGSSAVQMLDSDLRSELQALAQPMRDTWLSRLVNLSYYMPAWVQYVGQRVILLSPRLAHWVLRQTRIHHRWY